MLIMSYGPDIAQFIHSPTEGHLGCLQVLALVNKTAIRGFPGGAVVENLPANAGDTGSSPGLGKSHMPRSN